MIMTITIHSERPNSAILSWNVCEQLFSLISLEMMFNQIPVLFVDGEQIAHSRAALRYLAREFKMDGGDSLTTAKMDMWIEVLVEAFMKIPFPKKGELPKVSLLITCLQRGRKGKDVIFTTTLIK